jgi:hypothetical protein
LRLLIDLLSDVTVLNVIIGLLLDLIVFVFEDLYLGLDLMDFFLVGLTALFASTEQVVVELII